MPEENKRIIVVTGASRGIGRAICLAFATPGTHIVFNYYPEDPEAVVTEKMIANAGATVKSECIDVASENEVTGFINSIIKESGRIDVFVNNVTDERAMYTFNTGQYEWAAAQLADGRAHIQSVFTNRPLEVGIRYMKRWGD